MQREIKFRGKRVDNGEWVYGEYMGGQIHVQSSCIDEWWGYSIIPETVGQYTGLKDKNGKEIYEGDILELIGGTCNYLICGNYGEKYKIGDKVFVQHILSGYTLAGLNMVGCNIPNRVGKVGNYDFWNHSKSLSIIGNIHDNKELLKINS